VTAAFSIGSRRVGAGAPVFVVAEVAQTHDGSLGQAHAFIDAIAAAGADAVKFQCHIADAESTPGEPWRVRFSPQDATRYDYWLRMEWTEEQWRGLARHAAEKQLLFLCSPFSDEAVALLTRLQVPAWKVASGEVSNLPLLDRMAESGVPYLLSTGMSPLAEVDAAVAQIRRHGRALAVLQCTTAYPCPPEKVGLNLLQLFRDRYACAVGLSDHTGTTHAALAATALGADVLETHVTLSREMFGPDVASSITTAELRLLVEGIRFVERARANPVDKDAAARELAEMRRLFTKSVVAREALASGTRLEPHHLALKKPGTGLPAAQLERLLGRRLGRAVPKGAAISLEDLA
jgi:N-acetylneuraminate synthase